MQGGANKAGPEGIIAPRVVGALYVEAMLLADEVRAYFDEAGREERDALAPIERVTFSCESLKVTTRLMHIIAWLLLRRAIENGELSPEAAREPGRRLGEASQSDPAVIATLPERARQLIGASCDLYRRVARLDSDPGTSPVPLASPARALRDRLHAAY